MSNTITKTKTAKTISVFQRKGRKGWYYQVTENGVRSTALSVKALLERTEIDLPTKTKTQAEHAVREGLERDVASVPLKKYLTEYWDYSGERITRVNRMRRGKGISENYAVVMQGYIKNHIVPLVGGTKLFEVTPHFVRDVYNALIDKGNLANATIAKIMVAFTHPLKEAERMEYIEQDPTKLIDWLDTSPDKARGILTHEEVKKTLDILKKGNTHIYLAVQLAIATGMRQGEIRALTTKDIQFYGEDAVISITKSWATYGGQKETKGKKDRFAPCPTYLGRALLDLGAKNPHGETLIFWSEIPSQPISSPYLRNSFYAALDQVIDNREERNIVFHSLRHYFTTTAQAYGASGDLLRLTVGHQSQAMTDAYTHSSYDLVKGMAEVARRILE